MVALTAVRESNARIPNCLPVGLVAVFVGGTSGIGEYTLKEFARRTRRPRIYNIGRSQQASDRIAAECMTLNADVQYTFIQADVGLIRSVDVVCEQIWQKEKAINILFLSAATLVVGTSMYFAYEHSDRNESYMADEISESEEGLHLNAALKYYSRARFILKLLPLLEAASTIRRVVSVYFGTKEGPVNLNDIQGWNVKTANEIVKNRGHSSSMITLIHEHFAKQAPTVSFIHDFPGSVKSGIARGTTGMLSVVLAVMKLLGPLVHIPTLESGERHLFFATSARYPAKEAVKEKAVPRGEGVQVAMGTNGVEGSGVYSADQVNESAGPEVVELLERLKKEGLEERVWVAIEDEFDRITAHTVFSAPNVSSPSVGICNV